VTDHSQDKGSAVHRAVRGIGGDVDTLRYALKLRDDAVAGRNYDRETRASARYEELRLLNREQLAKLAGYDGPRQLLIAAIIRRELEDFTGPPSSG
jgi:hypothetical protein